MNDATINLKIEMRIRFLSPQAVSFAFASRTMTPNEWRHIQRDNFPRNKWNWWWLFIGPFRTKNDIQLITTMVFVRCLRYGDGYAMKLGVKLSDGILREFLRNKYTTKGRFVSPCFWDHVVVADDFPPPGVGWWCFCCLRMICAEIRN